MEPTAEYASCSACGTSPVNHRFAFITNVLDEGLQKITHQIVTWLPLTHEHKAMHTVLHGLFWTFTHLGLARFSSDRSKVVNERSGLIWNEAERRGIPMEQILLLGKPLDQYRAKINGSWVYFESLPIPYWLPQGGYTWVDDKLILAEKLSEAGVPAPRAFTATTLTSARDAFEKLGKPVIVKPRTGSRGRHTTTHISTLPELEVAFELGRQIARTLVIEEHLFGSVCRATVVNGKLVGFFKADPPQVTGDGVHTIEELIALKNKTRPERINEIRVTDDVLSFIARKGYALSSVLPDGSVLPLTAKTGRFFGGHTREMLPEVHPKLHEVFAKAAQVVDVPIAGFDLITTDPTADPDTIRWGIIECNSLPFIDLHYFPLEGEPNDLAPHVWDMWYPEKTTPVAHVLAPTVPEEAALTPPLPKAKAKKPRRSSPRRKSTTARTSKKKAAAL